MHFRDFWVGEYDSANVILQNRNSAKQTLLSEEEFQLFRFWKEQADLNLLSLLLPDSGIAKRSYMELCLRTLGKLQKIDLLDEKSLQEKSKTKDSDTEIIVLAKEKIRLESLRSLAATLIGLGERLFSLGGTFPLLIFIFGFASFGFVFFPFKQVTIEASQGDFSYVNLLFGGYCIAFLALSFRVIVQAAYLRANRREVRDPRFALHTIIPALAGDFSELNLLGARAKATSALLGILAPLALAGFFTGLYFFKAMPLVLAFDYFVVCLGVAFYLACPFMGFDGAEIIEVLGGRHALKASISQELRELFHREANLDRALTIGLIASGIWLLAWMDRLHSFWSRLAPVFIRDFYQPQNFAARGGVIATIFVLLFSILAPILELVTGFFHGKKRKAEQSVRVDLESFSKEFTEDKRREILEKLPIFSVLKEKERAILLELMRPANYPDGMSLVEQGEIGRDFFVLAHGQAVVRHKDLKGDSRKLSNLQVGDAFGEIALIDDVPRTVSVVSVGGCSALVLGKEAFNRWIGTIGSPERMKQMVRLSSFFRRHPLFNKLSSKDQAALIDAFRFQTIMPGDEVARWNDTEEHFYVVYSGKIRVDTGDDSADMILGADDAFGYSNRHFGKYFALEGTGLLVIRLSEFQNLIWNKLVDHPELFLLPDSTV